MRGEYLHALLRIPAPRFCLNGKRGFRACEALGLSPALSLAALASFQRANTAFAGFAMRPRLERTKETFLFFLNLGRIGYAYINMP